MFEQERMGYWGLIMGEVKWGSESDIGQIRMSYQVLIVVDLQAVILASAG